MPAPLSAVQFLAASLHLPHHPRTNMCCCADRCFGCVAFPPSTLSGSFSSNAPSTTYDNNARCSWLIETSSPGRTITLTLTRFDVQQCCDVLTVTSEAAGLDAQPLVPADARLPARFVYTLRPRGTVCVLWPGWLCGAAGCMLLMGDASHDAFKVCSIDTTCC